MTRLAVSLSAGLALAPMADAHPHAFIDTTMVVSVENGFATGIELTWVYDAMTSMLILHDRQLDPDVDGVLEPAELTALKGFDVTDWPEDFKGDLFVEAAGEPVEPGVPEALSIALDAEGRIVSRHRRSLPDVPVSDLVIRQYDPTFYIAYSLAEPITVTGGCAATVSPHDPEAALAAVDAELSRVPEDMFEIMKIGHLFADTVSLKCPASS
jgi:polyphosphate kinase